MAKVAEKKQKGRDGQNAKMDKQAKLPERKKWPK